MVTGVLTRLAERGFGGAQGLGRHRIAQAFGDTEMGFAIAFFHPGRHKADRNAARLGFSLSKMPELSQPFKVTSGRIYDLDLAGVGGVEDFLRARPETAHIFRLIDHWVRRVISGQGNIESCVEHAGLAERRAPAGERHQHVEIEGQARFIQKRTERLVRVKPGLGGGDPFGRRRGGKTNRYAAFFKRLADGGNTRGALIRLKHVGLGNCAIVRIDPPAGKDNGATGKGHACRPLDHQQFGWPNRPVAKDHQRCRRDRDGHIAANACCVVIHPERPILHASFGKGAMMGIMEILGVAASVSLLAGWRLYLCVFATGLAMRMGWIAVPEHLQSLGILTNDWVMAAAGIGMIAEFFSDKIAWLDSLWDAVHTAIRPVGGALLALALVDASDPKWQVVTLLLGGGAALLSHGAKAGTRAVVNASPEPFSNIAVSTGEDVATGGLLFLALSNPVAAIFVAIIMAVTAVAALIMVRRVLKKLFGVTATSAPPA